MGKRLISIVLGLLFVIGSSMPTYALRVFDISNLRQNILTATRTLQTAKNSLEQLKFLKKAIDNPKMYSKMVMTQIYTIAETHERIKGMTMDYRQIQGEWDKRYKDFAGFNNMSAREYADHANQTLQATNEAIYDAMRAQGLVGQMKSDVELLQTLLDRSATASGALEAAQIGHYIASVEITQLMRIQEIMAASYRAQCAYYEHLLQNEQMAKVQAEKLLINEPNPLIDLLGIGPGFGLR